MVSIFGVSFVLSNVQQIYAVFLNKPGKNSYRRPNVILVYKVLVKFLMNTKLKRNRLSFNQQAYIPGRSITNTLLTVVSRVKESLHYGEYVL